MTATGIAAVTVFCWTFASAQGRGGGSPVGGGLPGGRGVPLPDAAERPQEQPVFRSGVTLIQVDAFVTDSRGNPVTGLTAEDFEVLERGEPRDVATFAAVNIPLVADIPSAVDAEPDTATNAVAPGRTYLIAFDESPENVLRGRLFARRFILEHLHPNDVAAVALTGRGLASSGQDFTSNKRLLLAAIDKFSGGFLTGSPDALRDPLGPVSPEQADRQRQLASSLRDLTEFLATLPGRKTLLYIGEGLAGLNFFDVADYRGGTLTPAAVDAHAAVTAATRGNVTIYPIDPRGLTTELSAPESFGSVLLENRADFASLAQVTGGFVFSSSNNLTSALNRIVTENSSYYTIGFNSEYTRRDGRFVPVDVRVKRPGLQVRARDGYVAPLGGERRPERVGSGTRFRPVADALASPIPTQGVPIRVFAAPYKRSGDRATIAVAVEVEVSTLGVPTGGSAPASIEISYLATDSKGKVRPGRRHTATLSRAGAGGENGGGSGGGERWVRVLSQFELEDGRYQLRVAAGTPVTGASVIRDLEVPDFRKGALTMSGVSMTAARAAALPTVRPHDPLAGLLPGAPIASREFAPGEEVAVFSEVYDNRTPERGRASEPIALTVSLLSAEGYVVRTTDAVPRPSTATRRPSGGHGFTVPLMLDVAPGEYAVAVRARSGNGEAVERRIPIRVR